MRKLRLGVVTAVLSLLTAASVFANNANPKLMGGPGHPPAGGGPGEAPQHGAAGQAAPIGAHLTYYGGRVVTNIEVVIVLWGSGSYESHITSTAAPNMQSFYQNALNSAYVDWLDFEYNTVNNSNNGTKTNQHILRGNCLGIVQITPSTSATTVSDTTIQNELIAQIDAGHLPVPASDSAGNNNTYYAVFFPHGITITDGSASSCVAGGFCAYHGTVAGPAPLGEFYYGVHPDMQAGSGCDLGCGGSTTFNNETSVASHEMVETMTDAEVGLATFLAPPLAWYDNSNGEIGDICNAQQGTIVGGDGVTYTVQKEYSNKQSTCIVSEPTPTPTGTATPTPTQTPTRTATPVPIQTATAVPTATPTATSTPTPTVGPTATPTSKRKHPH
jgi:cell division septation protein DedD